MKSEDIKKEPLLSGKQLCFLVGMAAYNELVYNIGRLLAKNRPHFDFSLPVDGTIPFLSWTVLIYWGCVIFWVINYSIGVKYDKGSGHRFLAAHLIGETVCFLLFVFCPTIMNRPVVTGSSLWDQVVKLTYHFDSADNLFPSIHCFVSWLCWIAVRKHPKIPSWYQWVSLLLAALVCVSTLTVKQHVIVDVFSGVLLAEASYLAAGLFHKG